MTLSHKNHINLIYGTNIARVYYYQNELYVMIITLEQIEPFGTTKIQDMAQHLLKAIDNSPTVDLSFNHAKGSLSKNKQKKLKQLLQLQNVDVDEKILSRWLALLL